MSQAVAQEDETLAMLRDSVATFARQNSGPARIRARMAGGPGLDLAAWRKMAEAGWIGLDVAEADGGAGLGAREQSVVAEELGRALAPEPYIALSVLALGVLAAAPKSAERDRLLAGALSGAVIAPLAWQERANQLEGDKPLTQAVHRGTGWRLNGEKQFVDAAGNATDFLVTAAVSGGVGLFAVPAGSSGLEITVRPAIDGNEIATLRFTDCDVGEGHQLVGASSIDDILDAPVDAARLAAAAELSGIAARALDITVEYTKQRVQFGKPIASFQSIQHRLVDMLTQSMLARAAVANAVEQSLRAPGAKAARLAGHAAKARATDAAAFICRNAIQLHGAMGYTDECDIGLYLKRAINLGAWLGGAERQRQLFIALERQPG